MLCEMCGSEVPRTEPVLIDGVELAVCSRCSRFGAARPAEAPAPQKTKVSLALERRQRRMRTKDVYEKEADVLVPDYPARIRKARTARGLKQEELARAINEKLSVVNKLERGEMRPDDTLVAKLERALEIELRERLDAAQEAPKARATQGLTIGDLLQQGEE